MENEKQLMHLLGKNSAAKPNRKMADQESTRLLNIFPLEIWMLIFDNIFLPEDLHHLEKSSDFFEKMLQKTKTLFPKVIKLLSVQFPSGEQGKIAPDLLRCRLTCRTWQIGVDSVLQSSSNPSNLLQVESRRSSFVPSYSTGSYFRTQEKAEAFLQHFDKEYAAKPRNPFLTRSVCVMYGNGLPDPVQFTNKLLQILKKYGHHIWELGLQLVFSEDPFTATSIWPYNIFRDFLQLMPNLKVLKFGCFAIGRPSDDEWKALELSLESCVFPELKHLRHLLMSNVPTPVFDALLRRYSHVSMLSTRTTHVATSNSLMYTQPLPNLDQVAIYLSDINSLIQLDSSIDLWPLKTLILRWEVYHGLPDWQQLFQFLENRWADTLTELSLELFHRDFSNPLPLQVLPGLNLPNLKVFWFKPECFAPLDFILPMRSSLVRLKIQYYSDANGEELESHFESEGEIKFYKFRKNLMGSNIWKLFPKLQTVDYCNTVRSTGVMIPFFVHNNNLMVQA